jgi:hypothetical protein
MLIKVRSAYGEFDLEGCNPDDKGSDLDLALDEVLEQKDERLTEYGYNIVRSFRSTFSTFIHFSHFPPSPTDLSPLHPLLPFQITRLQMAK